MEIAQLKESNRMIQMRHELSQRQYESLNQSNFKQSLKLSYATRSILMAGVSMQYGQDNSGGGRKNLRDSLLGAGALQEELYSRNYKNSFNHSSIRKDSQHFQASSRNQANLKRAALNDATKYSYVSRQDRQQRDSDSASDYGEG